MSNDRLSKDSLNTLSSLDAGGKTFHYYSLPKAAYTLGDLHRPAVECPVPRQLAVDEQRRELLALPRTEEAVLLPSPRSRG